MQNTPSKRYHHLQPEERMTLASLVQQQYSACEIAKVLKRSTSTVTREIKRNAQSTGYSSQAAITCSRLRRIQARAPKKLHSDGVLFAVFVNKVVRFSKRSPATKKHIENRTS